MSVFELGPRQKAMSHAAYKNSGNFAILQDALKNVVELDTDNSRDFMFKHEIYIR